MMTHIGQEFAKTLERITFYLKIMGMDLNRADCARTFVQRLVHRWLFVANYIAISYCFVSQCWAVIDFVTSDNSFTTMTYVWPCQAVTFLCVTKAYYFIKYYHLIDSVISSMRDSFANEHIIGNQIIIGRLKYVNRVFNMLLLVGFNGVMGFALGPLVLTGYEYFVSAEIKLFLPFFFVRYPFDVTKFKFWIYAYIHQVWTAVISVQFIFAFDSILITCCEFISIQFISIETKLVEKISHVTEGTVTYSEFRESFGQFISLHNQTFWWVDMLEKIYTRSNLINGLTSSLILCLCLFNITTIVNFAWMTPFITFLFFGLWQMFFICYYGDHIMRTSVGVGDAIYASDWYKCNAAVKKDILLVLLRSQKPCVLTALRYTDINMGAFGKILSSSWSYFALLKSVYVAAK